MLLLLLDFKQQLTLPAPRGSGVGEYNMRILILDDDYALMRPRLLAYTDGIDFSFAESPEEAERILKTSEFDALLLDGHLGYDVNGPDVLRNWRASRRTIPPVFMISSDEEMQTKGIEAGAVGAISKDQVAMGDLSVVEEYLRGG